MIRVLVKSTLRHIKVKMTVGPSEFAAACSPKIPEGDTLVDGAMHSDCDECRAKVMIGSVKAWPARPEPDYVPEPMAGATAFIARAKQWRDGY